MDVTGTLKHVKSRLQQEGYDPAVVPGALHAALTVLERWGTMSFADVAAPGLAYAERGFPMRTSTARAIEGQRALFDKFPGNKKYWFKPDGSTYNPSNAAPRTMPTRICTPADAATHRCIARDDRAQSVTSASCSARTVASAPWVRTAARPSIASR